MKDYNDFTTTQARGSKQGGSRGPLLQSANSGLRKFSGALMGGANGMGLGSPLRTGPASPVNYESMPVFQIQKSKGIPGMSNIRTGNTQHVRMRSLMSRPNHKSGTTKFDVTTDLRTIAPLTSEDIGFTHNLGLMSTLR